jgi:hypothetical protein
MCHLLPVAFLYLITCLPYSPVLLKQYTGHFPSCGPLFVLACNGIFHGAHPVCRLGCQVLWGAQLKSCHVFWREPPISLMGEWRPSRIRSLPKVSQSLVLAEPVVTPVSKVKKPLGGLFLMASCFINMQVNPRHMYRVC